MTRGIFGNTTPTSIISRLRTSVDEYATVIVSGVERGGTSMVAAVLDALGVEMGNTGINYEDSNFLAGYEAQAQHYVELRNGQHKKWGFKMPDALHRPTLKDLIYRRPIHIIVFRNAVSNTDSFVIRGDLSIQKAMTRIVEYQKSALTVINDENSDFILVSYERATSNPKVFVEALVSVLNLSVSTRRIDDALSRISGDGGGYIPKPENAHFISPISVSTVPSGSRLAKTSLELLDAYTIIRIIDAPPVEGTLIFSHHHLGSWARIIFDFGQGFDMLASYNLSLETDPVGFEFSHPGTVWRIGIIADAPWPDGACLWASSLPPPRTRL